MEKSSNNLYVEAVNLLKNLIQTPSFSREEEKTADILSNFLENKNIQIFRKKNNVWAKNKYFDPKKPTILLNSHHDTVKANLGYTLNPFEAVEKDGKLYGLGSNDAGASLVSLLSNFLYFNDLELKYNLIFAATAEEEISGQNGISLILEDLEKIDFAIVGEPTLMNLAVAEKGLMVLDCSVKGVSGHAARDVGENAIYKALPCVEWFRTFRFPKKSEKLGEIKMTVSQIQAGTQHNVIPDLCTFVVDVRTTDAYSNSETLEIIQKNANCEVKARSTRLNPSGISKDHAIVLAAQKLGINCFGSPTLSDQALMPFDSVKIGVGDSERSHSPDEFVFLNEIEQGIEKYIALLSEIIL
ncbi:MAG: M20/M25/M40 family metallo-hydrolase [Bacteroidetes bacterium]|nr:MAG: M20/M25/M40 family metallo-hydrolase [Bacteroidota bacterium]